MTDAAITLTHEQAMAMLRQKRLLAIERRAMAEDEIRMVDAQIAGFTAAVEMIPSAPVSPPTEEPAT